MQKILALYDLEDNLITVFENTVECSNYLNIDRRCLDSFLSRVRCNKRPNRIKQKGTGEWYAIYEIVEE